MSWDLRAEELGTASAELLPGRTSESYLGHVFKAAPRRDLVAVEDIRDHKGVLLWSRGQAVTQELRERLIARRLMQPLEKTVEFRKSVRPVDIVDIAGELLAQCPVLVQLLGDRQSQVMLWVSQARLAGGPGMLVTLMAENRPEALRHSVLVAMIAVWLAVRLQLQDGLKRAAAEAGLLHDIGEMFLPLDFQPSSGRLDFQQWRGLSVHPLLSCSLLRESGLYEEAVVVAVREHHERMDGSGYPAGSTRISPLGRVLLSAEVLSTLILDATHGAARTAIALRMIPGQFPADVVEAVLERLRAMHGEPVQPHQAVALASAMEELLKRLQRAGQGVEALLHGGGLSNPQQALARRLQQQLQHYTTAIHDTGAPAISRHPDWLTAEPEVAVEVGRIIREMSWQLPGLVRHTQLMVCAHGADPAQWQSLLDAIDVSLKLPPVEAAEGQVKVVADEGRAQSRPD